MANDASKLFGRPVVGEINAYKAGHALHSKFVETVLNSTDSWTLDEPGDEDYQYPSSDLESALQN